MYGFQHLMTLNGLLRRLHKRGKRLRPKAVDQKALSSNSSSTHDCSNGNPQSTVTLPEHLIFKCLDNIDNPFTLIRLRAVNHTFRDYVDQRVSEVEEMDVRRVNFDAVSTSSNASCSSNESVSVILAGQQYHVNPHGYKLLARFEKKSIQFVVDECWTSTEVTLLCAAMSTFRRHVKRIRLDAPIIELLIASLSLIDLQRWFAFQCYLQAINDCNVHLRFNQPSNLLTEKQPKSTSPYWPEAVSLIIRTTAKDTIHLARLLDYGVNSRRLLDSRRLEVLRCVLVDVDPRLEKNRGLNRNIYHFRCWAGSAGFDDRFAWSTAGGIA
ncbi:hypothetical protein M3Y95_01178700 [Aphelenchoides besseyi]|nr:hypothetical protein M3Y95_01178700 [Aphelenchoides besseyi]